MIDFQTGQIVKSKAGRDKDRLFIITNVEGEHVYLVDGDLRKLEKPKKKKKKHLQPTNIVLDFFSKTQKREDITNAHIRKNLIAYQRQNDHKEE